MADRNDFDRDISGGDDFDWKDDDHNAGENGLRSDEDKTGNPSRNSDELQGRDGSERPDKQEDQTGNEMEDEESGKEEKPRKKKHRFGWIIPAVLIAVFVFSFYKFLSQYLTYQQAINEYKEMDSMISEIPMH